MKINETGLVVGKVVLKNIENKKNRNKRLDKMLSQLQKEVREDSNSFFSNQFIAAYKKFIALFHTTTIIGKPAPEILIDMILERGYLPTISRVVDSMNYISVRTGLTISSWDLDKVDGEIKYELSQGGEKYHPFMGEEIQLEANELIARDDEKVLCLVRYRDSQYAQVTLETTNLAVHIQGIKGIARDKVESALNQLTELLAEAVGGEVVDKKVIVYG